MIFAILMLADVKSGLEVLAESDFAVLKGKRVGLVTNHTGASRKKESIIDLIHGAKDVKLVALFSPEHGIRGTEDKHVDSSKDEKTGLSIHSLYGKTKKPTAEMLKDVDVLVFDIQDIGARFYTYPTTMAYCMEAAAELGKEVVVLDRPNPIGGVVVEGPILEEKLRGGFASYFALPTRHGMTVGEIAKWYNAEHKIGCKLTVVEAKGWKRSMFYDQTKIPWIHPSPNMKSLPAAINYPGLGSLEATNLSVGRGTETPFEHYGAPWIDAEKLVKDLNSRGLKGVRFKAEKFTPRLIPGRPKYPHTDEECGGFRVEITDREAYRPVTAIVHILDALYKLHPDKLKFGNCPGMIGRRAIEDAIKAGKPPDEIAKSWDEELAKFLEVRKKYLLYD